MIAVIIPAHDEVLRLGACLEAVSVAALHPALEAESVQIILVLDACTDGSADLADRYPQVSALRIDARNVGAARAHGATRALSRGARWLAFTDADSLVHADWLVEQLACEADAVCGTVYVDDWTLHSDSVRQRYESHYADRDGHRHIHGANLGLSRAAYLASGGFPALLVGEDVALVESLERSGQIIRWSARPRVATSARLDFRCAGGFGDFVRGLGSVDG